MFKHKSIIIFGSIIFTILAVVFVRIIAEKQKEYINITEKDVQWGGEKLFLP